MLNLPPRLQTYLCSSSKNAPLPTVVSNKLQLAAISHILYQLRQKMANRVREISFIALLYQAQQTCL
jgi:hypothetical protein